MSRDRKIKTFVYIMSQLMCLLMHYIIILIFEFNGYTTIHFLYVTPFIVFMMIIGYLFVWYDTQEAAIMACPFVFMVAPPIFFGVFFGLFDQMFQYKLTYVEDCQVIGQVKTQIMGLEQYQMLYVDFNMNGQNMLGYACSSSNHKFTMGLQDITPNEFLFYGDDYPCGTHNVGLSYFDEGARVLESKRHRLTSFNNIPNKRHYKSNKCYETYTFSQVKLPSWMCYAPNISQSDLIKLKSCYVHFYHAKGESVQQSIENSQSRQNLKNVDAFAFVSFTNLLVPMEQFICLLIFTYCPIIVALNILFVPLMYGFYKLLKLAYPHLKNLQDKIKRIRSGKVKSTIC